MINRPLIYLFASLMTVMASDEKMKSTTLPLISLFGPWSGPTSLLKFLLISWTDANAEFLCGQFSLVGSGKATLVKDGPAVYLLYTSGRRNAQFGHWWLKLKPRNDPVSNVINVVFSWFGLVKPIKDRMNVTLTLDKNIKNRFVFAILDRTIAKETHEKRFDLYKMTKIASVDIPSNLVVYTESQKLAELVLQGKTGDILRQSSGLESLIVTYLPKFEPENLNPDKEVELAIVYDINDIKSSRLVEFPVAFVDTVANLNLPGDVITKLNKNKTELQKIFAKREAEDRAEEIAKKKAEAKRAQGDRVKKLSPAEQRKFDEKERNREKKKEMKKRTKRA